MRLNLAAEQPQTANAFVPFYRFIGEINLLDPLAHGIAVDMDHGQEIVLAAQYVSVVGEFPSFKKLGPLRRRFGIDLCRVDTEGTAIEGGPSSGLLFLQGLGQRVQVFSGVACFVVLHASDEELHLRIALQNAPRDCGRKGFRLRLIVKLQHGVSAASVDQIIVRIQLRAAFREELRAGHISDLLGAPEIVPQLPAAEDVGLLLGDLDDYQVFAHRHHPF